MKLTLFGIVQRTSVFVRESVAGGDSLGVEITFPTSWDIRQKNVDVIVTVRSALMMEDSQRVSDFVGNDSELKNSNEHLRFH